MLLQDLKILCYCNFWVNLLNSNKLNWRNIEVSYFDWINMTKNWFEYDRKKITPTNMNDGTWPKDYTNEHERLNMIEIPIKMTEIFKWLKFIRTTNLNGWIWPK